MLAHPAGSVKKTAGTRDEVELVLDRNAAKPGEVLTGRVRIRGERYYEYLESVQVMLLSNISGKGWSQCATTSWAEFRIAPNEHRQLEFSLVVSEEHTFGLHNKFRLVGHYYQEYRVEIEIEVRIPLAACYQQLADCLASMARVSVTEWAYAAGGDAIAARLEPTGAARDLFDELQLLIFRSGPLVYGELVIDPRERTLADRLKARIGADLWRYPFRFRAAASDEVRAFFEQCLRPYLDAIRHLPIPAAVPPQNPVFLPRPSDCGAEPQE
jgi:hypothetical protein